MTQYDSTLWGARTFLAVLLGLFFTLPLQAVYYHFTRISLQAGLPSTLSCIHSDSRGYLWTGTRAGLGRFDGHEQYRYTFEEKNENSLPGDYIYQIFEDSY